MSKAAQLELMRLRLKQEMLEKQWEENFVSEIVLVAKEMGVSVNEIMEWTIMQYNTVVAVLRDYYDEQRKHIESSQSNLTLR